VSEMPAPPPSMTAPTPAASRQSFEMSGGPLRYSLKIGGHEMAAAVRSVTVHADGGTRNELPRVELDLVVLNLDRVDLSEAEITLTAATREALIHLGWTPPRD
jgi:hypothetical protein